MGSTRRQGLGSRGRVAWYPDSVSNILLQGFLTLFGLSLGLFVLTRLVPGGPCAAYYGERYSLAAAQHAICSARFGLGQPIASQYLLTIGGYLRGDLGFSNTGRSIWTLIVNQFPDTVLLVGSAIILQTVLGALVGAYAARHGGGRIDKAVLAVTEGVGWLPSIWLAYLLSIGLVAGLQWLPSSAEDIRLPVFWSGQWFAVLPRNPGLLLGDQLRHLVIPLAATVLPGAAVSTRVVRGVVLAALQHPALLTVRAAGVQPSVLLVRLTLLGVLESAGPTLAALLGTASVVGVIVNWQGDESLFWHVFLDHDWGVVVSLLLLGTLAVFLVSLGARLLRIYLDPSLRAGQPRSPSVARPAFVLDLWWIVAVPEGRAEPRMSRPALPLIVLGLSMVAIMAALALFAPLIAPGGSPTSATLLTTGTMNAPPRFALPGSAVWPLLLGTDGTGRPVLNWIVYGARGSLLVGVLGALGTVFLGSLLGILAAISRPVDSIIDWLSQAIQTIPPLPLLAVLTIFLASGRSLVVVVLFVVVAWPATRATIRVRFLDALDDGPAVAAQALGVALPRILARHVLPALVRPLLRLLTLTMGGILLTQAAFNALLTNPGVASWGTAIGAAIVGPINWWLPLAAGLALYLTVLALGLVERGLASWRIRPLPHTVARRAAPGPPSTGWLPDGDTLSSSLVPVWGPDHAPPSRSEQPR